jgi:3-oxoadipate enol-lactonase
MILSNSLGATTAMWQPQIDALTGNYRVLRYDTRGHGQSDTPRGDWTFDDLCADVIALMDHLGIGTCDFIGLSMGGMTGLGLALSHPDRVTRVICADARADAPPPFRAMWDERIAKVKQGGLSAIVDATLASWFTADWLAHNPQLADGVREMVLSNPAEGYVACCHALKTLDYLRHLDRMTVPVLYVGGDQDKGAAPAVMRDMADRTPGGRYVAIRDAAHVANLNQPETFNAAITEFLSGS